MIWEQLWEQLYYHLRIKRRAKITLTYSGVTQRSLTHYGQAEPAFPSSPSDLTVQNMRSH